MENNSKMDVSILDYRSGMNFVFRNIPKNTVEDDEILQYINQNFGYNFTDSDTMVMISNTITLIDLNFNYQLQYQKQIQELGFNLIVCCNCGNTLIHKKSDKKVQCNGCWNIVETQDCTDLNY